MFISPICERPIRNSESAIRPEGFSGLGHLFMGKEMVISSCVVSAAISFNRCVDVLGDVAVMSLVWGFMKKVCQSEVRF